MPDKKNENNWEFTDADWEEICPTYYPKENERAIDLSEINPKNYLNFLGKKVNVTLIFEDYENEKLPKNNKLIGMNNEYAYFESNINEYWHLDITRYRNWQINISPNN